jgi:uncharacterized membrane protein
LPTPAAGYGARSHKEVAVTITAHDRPDVAARIDEAKKPVSVAAGPYGHPFHPILVTVPIGAWVSSLVFDVASRTTDDGAALVEGAYWLIGIGIVGALIAAVFGLLDLLGIPRRSRAMRFGLMHLGINLLVVGLYVADFLWRRDTYQQLETPTGPLVLSIVALAFLAVSGWLGGMLAYRFGVRVASESVQAEGYR